MARFMPDVKRLMIEKKEEELFKAIIDNKGKVFNVFKIVRKWLF